MEKKSAMNSAFSIDEICKNFQ